MPSLLRITLRLIIIFAIITFAIQPFNWFCQITQKCSPFYISYYMPKRAGKMPLDIRFEITNYREDIIFFPAQKSLITVANKKHLITYHLKNSSQKTVTFRPQFSIEPEYAQKYLKRYQCLCFQQYRLKGGEEIDLTMEFEVDRDIENDKSFLRKKGEEPIVIRFKL